jgi:hypothetical protein
MKKIYLLAKKLIFTFSFLTLANYSSFSQTTLVAGDIAFTGYNATPNSPQSDAFSFVLLKNITAGTVIHFTDNAWGSDGVFRSGEQTVTWTTTVVLTAGREITISGPPAGTATASVKLLTVDGGTPPNGGTCSGSMLSLSVNGDQVIAYQSTTPGVAPFTFISAIHMNVYATAPDPSVTDANNWDNLTAANQTSNSSFKPTGLTTGTNCIWIGTQGSNASERNNARFNCTGPLATPAQVRAAVNNQANWVSEFAATGATPTWIPPSGCAFLGASPVPVKLLSFQAQNNISAVLLKWQSTNEINFSHYELERSFDNINFAKIASITSAGSSNLKDYSYIDKEGVKNNATSIFYRLKIVDIGGSFSYSKILSVKNVKDAAFVIDNLVNPIKDKISFTLIAAATGKAELRLTNADGKIILAKTVLLNSGANNIYLYETTSLAKGIYFLNVITAGENKVVKLTK